MTLSFLISSVHFLLKVKKHRYVLCQERFMFKRILFPTDFSQHTQRAMECIAGFPTVTDVILLHVIDISKTSSPSVRGSQEEYARTHLKNGQQILTNMGISVTPCLELLNSGTISECIHDVALREKATLIVMNAGGKGFDRGAHLGSIPFGVIHHSSVNQLILHHRVIEGLVDDRYQKYCPMLLSKVLIPLDFSSRSLEAVNIVSDIPGIGEILLMHVLDKHTRTYKKERLFSQAMSTIEEICSGLIEKGVSARGTVLMGDTVPAILRYANEEDVSVICAIPSGKSRIMEIIVGCSTCGLAEKTTRPVLILKELRRSS